MNGDEGLVGIGRLQLVGGQAGVNLQLLIGLAPSAGEGLDFEEGDFLDEDFCGGAVAKNDGDGFPASDYGAH